jgi:hypothetical protein
MGPATSSVPESEVRDLHQPQTRSVWPQALSLAGPDRRSRHDAPWPPSVPLFARAAVPYDARQLPRDQRNGAPEARLWRCITAGHVKGGRWTRVSRRRHVRVRLAGRHRCGGDRQYAAATAIGDKGFAYRGRPISCRGSRPAAREDRCQQRDSSRQRPDSCHHAHGSRNRCDLSISWPSQYASPHRASRSIRDVLRGARLVEDELWLMWGGILTPIPLL